MGVLGGWAFSDERSTPVQVRTAHSVANIHPSDPPQETPRAERSRLAVLARTMRGQQMPSPSESGPLRAVHLSRHEWTTLIRSRRCGPSPRLRWAPPSLPVSPAPLLAITSDLRPSGDVESVHGASHAQSSHPQPFRGIASTFCFAHASSFFSSLLPSHVQIAPRTPTPRARLSTPPKPTTGAPRS